MILLIISLFSLLIAIPGFVYKAGYSWKKSLIPFYNIGLFIQIIEFPIWLLVIIGLGMIFLPFRSFFATLLFVMLPFIVNDCYSNGKLFGFLTLIFPFIMYPYVAYINGMYRLCYEDGRNNYFLKNKLLTILLVFISLFVYVNFTTIVEGNYLVDKNNIQYVNDLFMSDGRIYNNYLDDGEKKIYMRILESTKNFDQAFKITKAEFSRYGVDNSRDLSTKISVACDAILLDHPEIIQYAGFSWKLSNDFVEFRLRYARNNRVQVKLSEIKINVDINKIKRETKEMTDIEKVRYVYDWIGENAKYNYDFKYSLRNQSIYNVFIKHKAVCAGFAKACMVIFQNIGIEAYGVTGYTSDLHMWNIVKIDGKYYNFDSTIAACRKMGEVGFYDGLKAENFDTYIVEHGEWSLEVSKDNAIYPEK